MFARLYTVYIQLIFILYILFDITVMLIYYVRKSDADPLVKETDH